MRTLFFTQKSSWAYLSAILCCVFLFAGTVHASYQEYSPGSTIVLGEFLYNDDYTASTDNCYITVFAPYGATTTDTQLMTADANGWHHYSLTASSTEGTWPAYMTCGTLGAGTLIKEDKTFVITSNIVSSSSVATLVNANTNAVVTSASTSLAAVVNANTASSVLTASTSLGASISAVSAAVANVPTAVWAFGSRTLSGFGTLVSDIWSNSIRTLTGAGLTSGSLATQSDVTNASSSVVALVNANTNTQTSGVTTAVNSHTDSALLTATSSVAAIVNANTNSIVTTASSSLGTTLSSIVSTLASLPASIWAAGTRTLTSGVAIASDIWSAATRTLTGAGLTSGSLAVQSDVTTASSSLAAVINANTNSVVTTASTSIGSLIGSSGGGSLTAAQVWSYAARTLTDATLTSGSLAVQSDVTDASSSVVALINANTNLGLAVATSSVAAVVNANTNSIVTTASTSLGTSLVSIASSISSLPSSIWAFGSRTLTGAGLTSGSLATQSDVATASTSLGASIASVPDSVWASAARTLTSFGTVATDVASAVNSHTDSALDVASSSVVALINANTNLGLTVATTSVAAVVNANTNAQTSGITSAVNSNTNSSILAASTSLATNINANTNSIVTTASSSLGTTLSGIVSSIASIPANVWAAGTRTLTSGVAIASDIWSAATRTLTGAGLTSGSLAVQSDITTATSSLASVINANTYSVVNAASTSIGALLGTSGGGSLTAAEVWSYAARTLTGASLTSGSLATKSDVNDASSSVVTLVNTNTDTQTSGITSSVNSHTDSALITATSSVAAVINANTNSIVATASTSLGTTLSSIVSSIASMPANVWAVGTRTLTSFGTLASDVWSNTVRTLTGAGLTSGSLATQNDVLTASSSIAAAIQNLTVSSGGWNAQMSDFADVVAGGTYRARVTVYNQNTLADPLSVPTITIYDSSRNAVVSGVSMTKLSTGVYEYTYSVSSSAAAGTWEAVASIAASGSNNLQTNDYFDVVTTPAQVVVQSMGSTETPSISANIRITNEGAVDNEYPYEWCVVSDPSNICGGGDDTYYASAAKLIHPGENFDAALTATVPLAGTYYFKVVAYFGSRSSSASRQFTAIAPVVNTGGGGGGGSGGGGVVPDQQPQIIVPVSLVSADMNNDGKVNGTDFSVLLAYWKTSPPFKNPAVDLNHDGKVDSIDFSILLYRWKN